MSEFVHFVLSKIYVDYKATAVSCKVEHERTRDILVVMAQRCSNEAFLLFSLSVLNHRSELTLPLKFSQQVRSQRRRYTVTAAQ